MKSEREIADEYPLHYHVWKNNVSALNSSIDDLKTQLERPDPRGRTPLMLAVTLELVECTRILIDYGADVNVENTEGWTVVQEASATGNATLLQLILEKRDTQRHNNRMLGVPALLQKLKDAPDFYMEMKWEFTSWLPLVSRLCPSDTYKVYKQGSKVRIDTTLLGFDQNSWQRGNKSYLFKGESEDKAILMEMDHEAKEVYIEELHTISEARCQQVMAPSDHAVTVRLTTPIVHTYVDTEKISFERNKSGIWGWRSDKSEVVNGRESKVFSATNVELVTKTRTEHLSIEDKAANRSRTQRFPLQSLLGVAQMNDESESASDLSNAGQDIPSINTSNQVTLEEYFDPSVDLVDRDIGRPKEMTTKVQKFKATLWLCEDFPLSLPEQIMPIVDLMAISSSHFAKLKDFIQMQLPSGFPIKIEIPLFHVMNACVTFGNVFGCDDAIVGVSTIQEDDRLSCIVDDSCFEAPSEYMMYGMAGAENIRRQFSMDEDDELLQYAIQQSLVDVGTENDQVDIWEALKAAKPSRPNTPQPLGASRSPLPQRPSSAIGLRMSAEEEQLQRAIAASLEVYGMSTETVGAESVRRVDDNISSPGTAEEQALAEALALSAHELELEERRRKEEDEILQRILQLSLVEK